MELTCRVVVLRVCSRRDDETASDTLSMPTQAQTKYVKINRCHVHRLTVVVAVAVIMKRSSDGR